MLLSFRLTFAYLSSCKARSVNSLAGPLQRVMYLTSIAAKEETGPADNLLLWSQRTIPNVMVSLLPTEVELCGLLLQSPYWQR